MKGVRLISREYYFENLYRGKIGNIDFGIGSSGLMFDYIS